MRFPRKAFLGLAGAGLLTTQATIRRPRAPDTRLEEGVDAKNPERRKISELRVLVPPQKKLSTEGEFQVRSKLVAQRGGQRRAPARPVVEQQQVTPEQLLQMLLKKLTPAFESYTKHAFWRSSTRCRHRA